MIMKLSEPKVITWWIAVVLGVLGILGELVKIPVVSTYAFWLVAVGFVLLALGTYLKDL
jgi:threonine/homoserine/homoserine lactone efflux protein